MLETPYVQNTAPVALNQVVKNLASISVVKTSDPRGIDFSAQVASLGAIGNASLVEFTLFRGAVEIQKYVHVQFAAGNGFDSFGFTFIDTSTVTGTFVYSVKARVQTANAANIGTVFLGVR